ncbi:MAG: pilus assembly protein [Pseudomonadota bacterium]
MIRSAASVFRRFRQDQRGAATFDFVIVVPLYVMLLVAAFETGFISLRQVLLDRGMDMAVRYVRLNTGDPPDYVELKDLICDGAGVIDDCENALKLEMEMQDPRGTLVLDSKPDCVNRSLAVQPAEAYETGSDNQIMFLRACVKFTPLFRTAIMGSAIIDEYGEYSVVSTSIYVSEPSG